MIRPVDETSYPLRILENPITYPEVLFWGGLWLTLQPLVWLVKAIQWILAQCEEHHGEIERFRSELWNYVHAEETKTISELREIIGRVEFPPHHLETLHALLSIKEFTPHIREILAGANLLIENPEQIVNIFRNTYPRGSSHAHLPDCSWGMSDRIVKQILFWHDIDGKFRMQLENSAFGVSVLENLLHVDDWLKCLATGKQIGPFGHSHHLDHRPISIVISS